MLPARQTTEDVKGDDARVKADGTGLAQIASSSSYGHSFSAPSTSSTRTPHNSDPSAHGPSPAPAPPSERMQSWRYPRAAPASLSNSHRNASASAETYSPSGGCVSLDSPALGDDASAEPARETGMGMDTGMDVDMYAPRRVPVKAVEMERDYMSDTAPNFGSCKPPMERPVPCTPYRPAHSEPVRRVPSPVPRITTSPPTSTPTPPSCSSPTPTYTSPASTVISPAPVLATRYKTHRFAIDVEAQTSPSDYANPDAWMSMSMSMATPPSRSRSPSDRCTQRDRSRERRSSGERYSSDIESHGSSMSPSPPGSPMPLTPATPAPAHRVVLGGIVSSPRMEDGEWDDGELSIEVPGIVLTEPHNPTRLPSPPPKHILLLPPTSLTLPMHCPTSPLSDKEKQSPSSPTFSLPFRSPSRPSSPGSTCGLFARRPSLMSLTSALRGGRPNGEHYDDDQSLSMPLAHGSGIGFGSGSGGAGAEGRRVSITSGPSRVYSPAFADLIHVQSQAHLGSARGGKWVPSANTIRLSVLVVILLLALGHFYMDTLLEWGSGNGYTWDGAITTITTANAGGVVRDGRMEGALRRALP